MFSSVLKPLHVRGRARAKITLYLFRLKSSGCSAQGYFELIPSYHQHSSHLLLSSGA
jgi:hypothetical protein